MYHKSFITFLIAWHLAISEWPIILSGEQILMKGNSESSAILAASAVLPLCGGPGKQHNEEIIVNKCRAEPVTFASAVVPLNVKT